MIQTNNPGIDILYDPWVDTDKDGISDFVEKGAPNGGDGNQDGTPDGQQPNVASLRNAVDATYVTLVSPAGTDLVRVTATENPSSGPLPEGVEFPIGFFEFTVKGIEAGESAEVTLLLPSGETMNTYYKYGPTQDNATDHWYKFVFDGTTGAKISGDGDIVVLHFRDGQRGDDDLTANGEIVEPGAPGFLPNEPPVVGPISAPLYPIQVNMTVAASASFSDPDAEDIHTATWDWGDDNSSPGSVIPVIQIVDGSHTYTTAGVYTITLTVTDEAGDSDQAVFQYVVIYDPSAGFVTGGGWIDSPAGAYTPDPDLTGKANFGFVARYKKGATMPTGQTEFRFRAGNIDFHSTQYQWLVIAGPHAKFKGSGTINGEGDYGFMLTATDGQIKGEGSADKFRMEIWDKDTDLPIYDNQLFAADDEAADEIEGGNIVIHK